MSTRLPRHSGPAPSGANRIDPIPIPVRNARICSPCSGVIVGPNGRSARHDLDLLERPGPAGGPLGDRDQLRPAARSCCRRRRGSCRCRGRPRRTSGSTCRGPGTPRPAPRGCPRGSAARLSWALAVRTILRAASASRTWAARASRSRAVIDRATGLLGVLLEDARAGPRRGAGRPSACRSTWCRAARPRRRAAARSAGPSGARRRGRRSGPGRGPSPRSRCRRGRGARAGRTAAAPQSSAFSISSISRSMGVRAPWSCRRASSLPATAITSSLPSSRATLIAAIPNPASSVTPSAIRWRASRDGRRTTPPAAR